MEIPFIDKLIDKIDKIDAEEIQKNFKNLAYDNFFYKKVFNSLKEGVIILTPEGILKYINSAACLFFSLNPDKSIGKALSNEIAGLSWDFLSKNKSAFSRDMEIFYSEFRRLNFYFSPVYDPDVNKLSSKNIIGYVMLFHDITQSYLDRQKKVESEKSNLISTMASSLAHEIGNPLNSLDIQLQLLEKKISVLSEKKSEDSNNFNLDELSKIKEEFEDKLSIARNEVKRLNQIVKQFLSASNPEKPNFQPNDINRIIIETVSFLEAELNDREILINLNLNNDIPIISVDANQIKQTLYNIVRNAMQATKKNGKITISSKADNDKLYVVIKDTGSGISSSNINNVFYPYFTTKEAGNGLGLFIVRQLIEMHQGEISIESSEEEGTIVTISLPFFKKYIKLLE